MKMISECPIVEKGKFVIELLALEHGVVNRRSNKEAEIDGSFRNFIVFINIYIFCIIRSSHL